MASQYTDWSSVCQSNCEMDIARDIIRDGQQIENRIGYSERNVLTFDDKRHQDTSPNLLTIQDPSALQNSRNHTPITPINLPKSSKARPSFQYNRCSYNFGAPFQNSNNNPEYHLRHPTVFLGNPNSANGTRLLANRNRENTETDSDQNSRSTTFRPTDHDRKNPQYIDFTTPGIVRAPYEVEISNSKNNSKTKNTLKRTISNISEKIIQSTNCCSKWRVGIRTCLTQSMVRKSWKRFTCEFMSGICQALHAGERGSTHHISLTTWLCGLMVIHLEQWRLVQDEISFAHVKYLQNGWMLVVL